MRERLEERWFSGLLWLELILGRFVNVCVSWYSEFSLLGLVLALPNRLFF